jgi:hypothetical protein
LATLNALLQVGVMLLLAPVVGVSLSPAIVLGLVPIVVLLAMGLAGLGLLIASFMTSQQGFQLILQLLVFPLIFLAGVFFLLDRLDLKPGDRVAYGNAPVGAYCEARNIPAGRLVHKPSGIFRHDASTILPGEILLVPDLVGGHLPAPAGHKPAHEVGVVGGVLWGGLDVA